jgi:hypothetical protein
MRQFELRPFRRDAAKFLSRRKFTGIEEEFYGDQRENLRGSRKNFTGIEEEIYRDRRRISGPEILTRHKGAIQLVASFWRCLDTTSRCIALSGAK